MPWNRRGYYRRSLRVNGRVITEYIGRGPGADLAAKLDAVNRDVRDLRRVAERIEREKDAALDALLDELDALVDDLVRAHLLVEGYHQHDRGQWRKRRAKHNSEFPDKADPLRLFNARPAADELKRANAAIPAALPAPVVPPADQPANNEQATKDNRPPTRTPIGLVAQPPRRLYSFGRGWTRRLFAPPAPSATRPLACPATTMNAGPTSPASSIARSAYPKFRRAAHRPRHRLAVNVRENGRITRA